MLSAVVTAAGEGRRFGGEKILAPLRGRPLLLVTLERVARIEGVGEIVLVLPAGRIDAIRGVHGAAFDSLGVTRVVGGGETRQDSVEGGVRACAPEGETILVHDAVRPNFAPEAADAAVRLARRIGAAIVATPARDTLKRVDGELRIVETVSRDGIWHAETPQVFRREVLEAAYARARADDYHGGTDEAALVERSGAPVGVVRGAPFNVKVTEPADLLLLEALLTGREER